MAADYYTISTMNSRPTKILVIDNYDSFVFNLVQYLQQLGADCTVVRNDSIKVSDADNYDGVLISPGPGTPEAAGISVELVKYCAEKKIPLFGVCLGHQAIAVAYGATVSRAPELLHGKTSIVQHSNKSVLADIPSPFTATRYHSLAVEKNTLPDELEVTGATESGVVMAVQHKTLPICGREMAWIMPDTACSNATWLPVDTFSNTFVWS
jgi:para-aminobenzoate synthetase component 2